MKMLDGQSFDMVHDRIESFKQLFPEAVNEGRLEYDMLMTLLGDEFDNSDEKYQFPWKGKLNSLRLLSMISEVETQSVGQTPRSSRGPQATRNYGR